MSMILFIGKQTNIEALMAKRRKKNNFVFVADLGNKLQSRF